MKRIQLGSASARFLTGLFVLLLAALIGYQVLAQTSIAKPATSYAKKTINIGYADWNGTKATGTTIGGANCSAIDTRHKLRITASGDLLGVVYINDCKQTSPATGEGGQTDAIDVYANLVYNGVLYPLYQDYDGADRVATLSAGQRTVLWLKGAIPVQKGDVCYIQTSWEGATASINFPRLNEINLNEDEGYAFQTNATPSVNVTNSRAQVDTNEWLPTVGNQKKSDLPAGTRLPAPAALHMSVAGDTPHVAIRGTSRSIGGKNWFKDPTLYNDSYIAAACNARGVSYVLSSVGASIGANDYDNPQYNQNRRWLEQGATIVFDEHLQNDLANDYSIADIQRRMLRRYADRPGAGTTGAATYVICTVDPWTNTSAAGDWTSHTTQTVADSDTSTKRTYMNAWMRASRSGACTGGNPTVKLYQVCDKVCDSASVVEYASDKTLWKDAVAEDAFTVSSSSSTTVVGTGETWSAYAYPERFVKTLTSADAAIYGIVTSNAPASLANTSNTLTVASWSSSTPGAGKAGTIYATFTNDGLHATEYADRLKQGKVEPIIGGTSTTTFNGFTSIPWDGFWTATADSCFTDTGCSINAGNTDAVSVWVDRINGLKATGSLTTRPTYSTTPGHGSLSFDGSNDYMDFTTALASITNKQHRCAIVTVLECPDSNSAAQSLFYISNNAGNTRFHAYFETGGGASKGLPAQASRVDEAGTANTDNSPTAFTAGNMLVRIDYVDWQEAKAYIWVNGTILLDDTAAWSGAAGLSVATNSTIVTMSRSASQFLNAKVYAVGVVNNFEFTPYYVSQLTSWLTSTSNYLPSSAAEEFLIDLGVSPGIVGNINEIAERHELVGAR